MFLPLFFQDFILETLDLVQKNKTSFSLCYKGWFNSKKTITKEKTTNEITKLAKEPEN